MADVFTRQLPEARDVTGSTPIKESKAAAIGEGLKGLASIMDVGLKASAEARESRVLGTVEDSLAQAGKEFTSPETPQLVGEEGTAQNPEDIGYTGEQWSRMDRLRQGNAQGRVSRAEFYAKTSSIVQQAIHDNPRFADSIRKRAQDVLGIAPTTAAIALEAEGQKAAEDLQTAAKTKLLEIGITQYGIADMFPDGTFNVQGSIPKVQRAIATNAYLKSYNDVLDANLKYKQLMAGPTAKEPTLSEKQDLEYRMFTGGDQSSGYQGTDTIFHDQIDSFFSTVPSVLEKNKNLAVPDQEAMILGEIGQRRLIFMGWLNSQLNQVTMSAETKEKIRKNYLDQFSQYEDWSKGGFSNFARNAGIVKQLETQAGRNAWDISRVAQTARVVYGENVWTNVASVALAGEAGTKTREALDREALNIGRYLEHGARVAGGNASTAATAPEDQPGNMRVVRAAANAAANLINSGQSVSPEQDANTFGYSMADIVNSAQGSQNVDNLRGAVVDTANPGNVQALETLKKFNPELAEQAGKGMAVTNAKAIVLTGQSLVRDVAAANQQLGFLNREGKGGPEQQWTVVYDADEGIYKVQNNIPESEDLRAPLPLIPKTIAAKIRDMNQAARANVQLTQQFGTDREKGLDEATLKLEYAKRTGLQVVGGEVESATSADNGGKGRVSAYPTGMVEPGNLDALGRKELLNPDGSTSTALTFSRQDEDGLEVLVPQVVEGVKLSEDAAWKHYKMTGEHFGKFSTPKDADAFANDLHQLMEEDLTQRRQAKEAKKAEKAKKPAAQVRVVD